MMSIGMRPERCAQHRTDMNDAKGAWYGSSYVWTSMFRERGHAHLDEVITANVSNVARDVQETQRRDLR